MKMLDGYITKLEDLSNEVLIEIFEYLPGEELFQAFNNLQYRINQILNDARLLMRLTFTRLLYMQSLYDGNQIRLVNITSSGSPTFAADLQDSSIMSHAFQLTIDSVYIPDLIVGLSNLKSRMPNLIHVSIKAHHHQSTSANNNTAFIIRGLLDLPHIRTLALNFNYDSKTSVHACLSDIKQTPFLERLSIIGCSLSLLSIVDLMTKAPLLDSLQLQIRQNNESSDYSVFRQLVRATLQLIEFDELNLQKIFRSMTNIVSLRLDNDTMNSTARLCLPQTIHITQMPIGYFDH